MQFRYYGKRILNAYYLDQNIIQRIDQQIKSWMQFRYKHK